MDQSYIGGCASTIHRPKTCVSVAGGGWREPMRHYNEEFCKSCVSWVLKQCMSTTEVIPSLVAICLLLFLILEYSRSSII